MKRFTSPEPTQDADPIPFELEYTRFELSDVDRDGQTVKERVGKRVTDSFLAHPEVSGGVTLQIDLMGGLKFGQGRNARGADALLDFYEAALLPEDWARFKEIIDSKDCHVHSSILSEIAVWLYEQYSQRPTSPPRS